MGGRCGGSHPARRHRQECRAAFGRESRRQFDHRGSRRTGADWSRPPGSRTCRASGQQPSQLALFPEPGRCRLCIVSGKQRAAEQPVQLWLVEASAPQITNAVHELQQEGAAVLATVPGPRLQSGWLARDAVFRRSALPTQNSGTTGPQRKPSPAAMGQAILAGDHSSTARPDDSPASEQPSSDVAAGLAGGLPQVDQSRSAARIQVPAGQLPGAPARGLELGLGLERLGREAGNRPLQVLFVLRGNLATPPAAAGISEAGEPPLAAPIEPMDPP